MNDDPFERRLGAMLTGPGDVTVEMYSAAVPTPLLLLWGFVERVFRRTPRSV